ncbi:MAG TPA: hypothetical protein VLY63_24765, partial [Anaerolineae bacterium]|nr:hypothetical protein [Anaerolineae bacterium]
MKAKNTANLVHVTERQKAWARLALLTVVGLVCPPLAAARSGVVWGIYLLVVVAYSLWTVRITRLAVQERNLGYLLCVADAMVLVPIMVWSLEPAMPTVLGLLWLMGVVTSVRAARSARGTRSVARARREEPGLESSAAGAPLERALRVRLRALSTDGTRFALVLLKLEGHTDMIAQSGKDATKDFLREAGRRGLDLLGPDAQLFPLPGGRLAFLFASESVRGHSRSSDPRRPDRVDPYDTESLAMALAVTVCEKALGGRRLECVAGWATAPADGTNADDLMYAAESGALSTAAFRRVRGSL